MGSNFLDSSKTIYVHVGYARTGSTFLQNIFFRSLPLNLILSPDLTYLANETNYDDGIFRKFLVEHGTFNNAESTLISSELFTGRGDGNPVWNPTKMTHRLKKTFPNAKIIVVIRNQIEFVRSIYTHKVVSRIVETRSLDKYLESYFENQLKPKLEYENRILQYYELFGRTNVLVLPYELLLKNYKSYLSKLCEFMNINVQDIKFENKLVNHGRYSASAINISTYINKALLELLNLLKQNGIVTGNQYNHIIYKLNNYKTKIINPRINSLSFSDKPLKVSRKWEQKIESCFKTQNKSLNKLINMDLKEYHYPI